ncbi:hypothetical protein BGZ96_007150 [Linnemannia gamsii]|uniref:Tex-like protein N-terminal domain-containing protein n=1 Tax=Linnemannia gamsii TaxID=64522 RepID=A0ABQ7KES3_9FUNG|nr:hypothetical protein BGZ96_007150 [Linnemannia gamsii]
MTDNITLALIQRIATELAVAPQQIAAAVQLLDGGATVPFIARYRKEATGNLDDTQLRTLDTRLVYLRELEARRATILNSIEEQGKLTETLRHTINAAQNEGEKFRDYYNYAQSIRLIPSHRALALFRGRGAGVLQLKLSLEEILETQMPHPGEAMIAEHVGIVQRNRAADIWLASIPFIHMSPGGIGMARLPNSRAWLKPPKQA